MWWSLIAILSDIHGNYPALEAVLDELDRLSVSTIICLGDTAGYYSQVNETCDALRVRNVFSLMGNHDRYLTSDAVCPRSNSATRCIEYQASIIEPSHLEWLGSLPDSAQMHGLDIVHGGWRDHLEEYMIPTSEYFSGFSATAFASGHTHEQLLWSDGSKTYCNPGSVGQPRDGDPRAAFATWDGTEFQAHRVTYDIAATQYAMHKAGFDEYFYRNLSLGLRIGSPNIASTDR
jgi:predicted phosphodiesterase